MRNGWLAFSLLAAACVGAAARPVIFPVAGAAASAERCEWRYLSDTAHPEIPTAEGNGAMDQEWAALSAAGYHLAATLSEAVYVFERCVPAQ